MQHLQFLNLKKKKRTENLKFDRNTRLAISAIPCVDLVWKRQRWVARGSLSPKEKKESRLDYQAYDKYGELNLNLHAWIFPLINEGRGILLCLWDWGQLIKAENRSEKLISRLSKTHSNTALRPLCFLLTVRPQISFLLNADSDIEIWNWKSMFSGSNK